MAGCVVCVYYLVTVNKPHQGVFVINQYTYESHSLNTRQISLKFPVHCYEYFALRVFYGDELSEEVTSKT